MSKIGVFPLGLQACAMNLPMACVYKDNRQQDCSLKLSPEFQACSQLLCITTDNARQHAQTIPMKQRLFVPVPPGPSILPPTLPQDPWTSASCLATSPSICPNPLLVGASQGTIKLGSRLPAYCPHCFACSFVCAACVCRGSQQLEDGIRPP